MESVQFSLQEHLIPNCFEECATTTKNISNSNAKFVKFVRNRSKTSNFRHFFALFTKLHPMMPHWGSPLPSLTPGPSPAESINIHEGEYGIITFARKEGTFSTVQLFNVAKCN